MTVAQAGTQELPVSSEKVADGVAPASTISTTSSRAALAEVQAGAAGATVGRDFMACQEGVASRADRPTAWGPGGTAPAATAARLLRVVEEVEGRPVFSGVAAAWPHPARVSGVPTSHLSLPKSHTRREPEGMRPQDMSIGAVAVEEASSSMVRP